ncbi:MAG: hypothetical protein PVF17_04230 [Ignavibacteria bacterium]|jgi:hypothetical protein
MRLYHIKDNLAEAINQSDEHLLEQDIEDFIQANPHVLLNEPILLIGRQIMTANKKILDLVAVDKYGRIIIAELKKGSAPRDMMAQILDYSSWLSKISERELEQIAKGYFQKYDLPYNSLHQAFQEFYKVNNIPQFGTEIVNVLFAQSFSEDLLGAVSYLKESGVPIYLLKFQWYRDDNDKYISIEMLVGEDEDNWETIESLSRLSTKGIKNKLSYRGLFNNIKKYLEANCENWAAGFNAEWKGFIVYQTRVGDWVSVRGEWKLNDGYVHFAFGLSLSKERNVFICRVSYPRQFNFPNKIKLAQSFKSNQFVDKSLPAKSRYWEKHTAYTKYLIKDEKEGFTIEETQALDFVKREIQFLQESISLILERSND